MIRGTKRKITDTKKIDTQINIHNRFDIEVIDARTGDKRQEAKAYNVVCDNMWTELDKSHTTSKYEWFNKITYGRGNGTPSSEDADLFSTIASVLASDLTYGVDYANAVCWIRKSIHIDELTSNGETISEIGIRSTNGVLCTHAMLQDMNGNHISIQKSNTDILNIYATVYVHLAPELLDVNNTIQVDLSLINNGLSFLRWLAGDVSDNYYTSGGLKVFNPLKGRLHCTDQKNSPRPPFDYVVGTPVYDAGSRTYTLTGRCPYDQNNDFKGLGWWSVLSSDWSGTYSYEYENPQLAIKAAPPVFGGSKIVGEEVGTGDGLTTHFATKFDYPENAKVYVDGVLRNDVTVDKAPLYNTHMGQYFEYGTVKDGVLYPKFNAKYVGYYALGDFDAIGFSRLEHGILYNPNYMHGISSFYADVYSSYYYGCTGIAVSDDLINWDYILGDGSSEIGNATVVVPEEHRYKKYWKVEVSRLRTENDICPCIKNLVAADLTGSNIHFGTPPAEGAVITIDYDTQVIAKDINHVFDLSLTVHLGEYSGS